MFGALFDWDGVVVDSSRHHERSWERLAVEEGHVLPADHFKRGFGMRNEVIIPTMLGWTQDPTDIARLSLRKEELYREEMVAAGLVALPGVVTWLDRLRDADVPCVIASSTHRENIECGLRVLGLEDRFRDMVCSEDVHHGKPNPDVFLLAAGRSGHPPACCVVFEDVPAGVRAGRAAGCLVVAVTGTHPRQALDAHLVVDRLDELDVNDLATRLERKE